MKTCILAMTLVLSMAVSADAGRRCSRSWQSYSSYKGWSHGCTATGCHQKKQEGWRESLAKIAERKADNEAFYQSLSAILGTQEQQPQGYGSNVTYNGLYQSAPSPYGYAGATAFGASAYQGNPWAKVSEIYQQHKELAQQLNQGGVQATDAHARLAAQEAVLQMQATNFNTLAQALTTAMTGPQPVPKLESLQFQVVENAQGQQVLQAAMPGQGGGFQDAMAELSQVVTNKCISCHSGEAPAGKIDMSGQLTKLQLQAMADAVDSSKMPLNPDGTPGERLSHEERDLFDNAAKLSP